VLRQRELTWLESTFKYKAKSKVFSEWLNDSTQATHPENQRCENICWQ
jgi:hypothetical protein